MSRRRRELGSTSAAHEKSVLEAHRALEQLSSEWHRAEHDCKKLFDISQRMTQLAGETREAYSSMSAKAQRGASGEVGYTYREVLKEARFMAGAVGRLCLRKDSRDRD
jgi:hypothetical protein